MTLEELKKLDAQIAADRAERETISAQVEALRIKSRSLSERIRASEVRLPTPSQRRGITMKVEAAKVSVKPGKG